MDNLLFYALIMALLYYFLVYLPAQKPSKQTHPDPQSSTTSQSTQTELTEPELPPAQSVPQDQKDLENTLDFLIKGMADLSKDLDKL